MQPHIKLLKSMRFKGLTQIVICPAGRCLQVLSEGDDTLAVEIEEGEGTFVLSKRDHKIAEADIEDMVSEPEYNDYESYGDC